MSTTLTSPITAYDLNELTERLSAAVLDTDILFLVDPTANPIAFYFVKRSSLLKDVLRTDGTEQLAQLTLTSKLVLGANLANVSFASAAVTVPAIASGAQGTATAALSGSQTGDTIIATPTTDLPAGLILQNVRCSVSGTIQFVFFNADAAGYAGGSITFQTAALRLS